ncbi:uncharacterized protein CMC5_020030 [Chondromyces crocatus]|uniref:Co-chaperone DjlA N-terminal domain-containing protein n=2 Tax=Chondromyces crocatus TaxID=52 RepID=A0A0K1EAG0_CHOCO|nr:uncharacterized protein CMC5_020030 [Chondromyces crocatus]
MIAAANVDGHIDPTERAGILDRVTASGLPAEEREALAREIDTPWPPYALLGQLRSRDMAEQFYLVSLLAIEADTEAEHAYLRALPGMLGLRPDDVTRLHAQLGLTAPT